MSSNSPTVSNIKRAQKESLIFQEISSLFMQASLDDKKISGITISRVKLSPDKGICTIFFYTADGKAKFDQVLPNLILYKPSLRKALANKIKSRYTPELIFTYDENFEKQQKLEAILEKVKHDA